MAAGTALHDPLNRPLPTPPGVFAGPGLSRDTGDDLTTAPLSPAGRVAPVGVFAGGRPTRLQLAGFAALVAASAVTGGSLGYANRIASTPPTMAITAPAPARSGPDAPIDPAPGAAKPAPQRAPQRAPRRAAAVAAPVTSDASAPSPAAPATTRRRVSTPQPPITPVVPPPPVQTTPSLPPVVDTSTAPEPTSSPTDSTAQGATKSATDTATGSATDTATSDAATSGASATNGA